MEATHGDHLGTDDTPNAAGTLLGYQPYGADGLLVADLDLAAATCLLARRYRDVGA